MAQVGFNYGPMADTLEKQAKAQGYTLGNKAKFLQDTLFGLTAAYINGAITPSEFDKILPRFQKNMIVPNLKPLK